VIIERDHATKEALEAAGWLVIVVWEHDDVADAARRVAKAVRSRAEPSRLRQRLTESYG
jgi:DNA mismatch endonuclease, patch repair protein